MSLMVELAASGASALSAGAVVGAVVELEEVARRPLGTATPGDTVWALATPSSETSELKRIAMGNTSPAHEGFEHHGVVLHADLVAIDQDEVV